jgi:TonB family protein
MSTLETFLLNYALNATWQIPVVFAAAWLAARLSRRLGPPFQHRLSVSTFVVEVFLPACSVQPAPALRTLQYWLLSFTRSDLHSTGHVTVTMGPVHAEGGLQLPPALLAAVALLYLGSILFFAAKLSVGLYRTMRLRRHARPITLSGHASQSYQRLERLFCIKGSLLATSPEIAVPMTMGVRHRMLMLPAGTEADLTGEDLDAALAHEFAHMRRYDFAKNLLYQMLSLPVAFHPLLWLTRSRIAETRELLCDSLAAEAVAGRQRYARSLLRLASKFSDPNLATIPQAIGIFDANHFKNFERRVMHLTNNPIEMKGARRLAIMAASLFLVCAACTSALALRMQVVAPSIQVAPQAAPEPAPAILAVPHPDAGQPPQTSVVDIPPAGIIGPSSSTAPTQGVSSPNIETAVRIENVNVRSVVDARVRATVNANVRTAVIASVQATPDTTARVSGGVMAENRLNFIPPIYPQAAKEAKLEGSVVLHALIAKDGTIQELTVVSGPKELQDSALDAVKQWTYKPYLLNGEPIAVETTITVTYSLQN